MRRTIVLSILLAAAAVRAAAQVPQYFPDRYFSNDQQKNDSIARSYERVLKSLNEPALFEQSKTSPDTRVYRFLWLRALAVQSPISIRMDVNEDGTSLLTVKIMTSRVGEIGGLKESTKKLSRKKTERFLTRVRKARYWDLPMRDPLRNKMVLDGSEWLIEGVENGNYKLVDRISPEKGPVRQLGISLIRLAGLELSSKD